MFEVCSKSGMEIDYLTLEPIAALESTLSQGMRSLDTVLVDIGAGTSDIAIVARGRVEAYGMVPMAGDSLTDALCSELLIDFNEAERIKRQIGNPELLSQNTSVDFNDIFGRRQQRPARELFAKLRPAVTALAERISDEIKRLLPSHSENLAMILVGGGSLTPMLEQDLASATCIAPARVGKRAVAMNRDVEDLTGLVSGPDAATVAGIAMLVARRTGLSLTHLTLNEKRITMVNARRNPTVLSVLLSNGLGIRQIYGRPGMAKTITLNGALVTLKGEMPVPATVELNGNKASFDTQVKEGDKIVFFPAIDGADASKKICEVLPAGAITFNGEKCQMPMRVTIDEKPVSLDAAVYDRAAINYEVIANMKGALEFFGIDGALADEKGITVEVNGQYVTLRSNRYALKHNNVSVDINKEVPIVAGDVIEFKLLDPQWKIEDIVSPPASGNDLHVKINGEERVIPGRKGTILQNGKEVLPDQLLKDGDIIRTIPGKDSCAVMVDVFRYIAVDPSAQAGKRLRLLLNNHESQFTTPLFEGADIKVLFVDATVEAS
jgi:cell division ATPase FtsA